ncbi:MAG: HAMP domain-containing protein, partial [Gammaproteobacteria bacterium]|nr:HAMP domain-containing protein [Gammaproteobacteria bacterium]
AQTAMNIAYVLSRQADIIEAVANNDRRYLHEHYQNLFQQMKKDYGIKQMHFHRANNVTVYRGHHPDMHSDDLTQRRPDVAKVNKEQKGFSGLTVGKSGIGIRGIMPIFKDGKHVGAMEIGMPFNDKMLTEFKQLHQSDVVVHLFDGKEWQIANKTHDSQLSPNQVSSAMQTELIETTGDRIHVAFPLKDSMQNSIGVVEFIIDNKHNAAIKANMLQAIAVSVVMALLLLILILWLLKNHVSRPLKRLSAQINVIADNINFQQTFDHPHKDEIGHLSQALTKLFANTSQALNEANQVVSDLAKGNISSRMSMQYTGDLSLLANGMNQSLETIDQVMQHMSQVTEQLSLGRFHIQPEQMSERGIFAQILTQSTHAMHELQIIVQDINLVMRAMAQGDFSQRITVSAQGDLLTIKNQVNLTLDALAQAVSVLSQQMTNMAQGQLVITNSQHAFAGELARVEQGLLQANHSISGILQQVDRAIQTVTDTAYEVTQGTENLSHLMAQQLTLLSVAHQSMNDMATMVSESSKSAIDVEQLARHMNTQSEQGSAVMQQTIDAMKSIQQASHRINDIVNIIDGIAFQTNLLALNAAVEAARAGEHGRGFAVVASEVRALAGKSAEAAKDIRVLIEDNVQRIDSGTKLADESGRMLNSINQSIGQVTSKIESIAHTAQAQQQSISQVYAQITQLNQATESNTQLIQSNANAAQALSEQAGILSENMAFFKT